MREEMLSIEDCSISSSGNTIISQLYLQIYKAEIFGIILDRMIDRKCLLELLRGNVPPASGRIFIEGRKIVPSECPRHFSQAAAVIDNTSKLISSLSIAENVLLFSESIRNYIVEKKKYDGLLDTIKKKLMVDIDTDKPVSCLSIKERVIIELIRAYAEGKKLVVMADITGFLKSTELEEIFRLICRLRNSGTTFIIIEVYGDIVFKWADRLSVIREGKTLGIFSPGDIKRQQIFSAIMKGRKRKQNSRKADAGPDGQDFGFNGERDKTLEFVDINTQLLKDLNLSVGSGEVLKIYYMDDASCSHIIELLKGMRRQLSGRMLVAGKEYRVRDTHQAVDKGICFIEESPYKSMFVSEMSIMDNLCLPLARKVPLMWARNRYGRSIKELVSQFIDIDIGKVKLSALSHVQLQQIAYLKWYMFAPAVVVCIKPFTEVDIHIREVTVEMIGLLQKRGISVVILTPNFSETYLVDGETLYIKDGRTIGEDEVYQIIYGSK